MTERALNIVVRTILIANLLFALAIGLLVLAFFGPQSISVFFNPHASGGWGLFITLMIIYAVFLVQLIALPLAIFNMRLCPLSVKPRWWHIIGWGIAIELLIGGITFAEYFIQ